MTIQRTYVTDGESFLIQLPADNQWGFSLFDDDQTWAGGFGSGMDKFWPVSPEEVPAEDRERLEWLFNAE